MIYYHFTGTALRDGKPIPPIGEWLTFDQKPIPCERGLHASPDAFDALQYAPGALLHQVELDGEIVAHGSPVDKFAAQRRKIVASIDATDIMRLFARRVALDVINLWDAPAIVREYLETGDESKRAAAEAAAGAGAWAARVAARVAAKAAAWHAEAAAGAAAWAAGAAAWDAAWNAETAAWNAAGDAARAAKQKLYRGWFNEMVEAAFAIEREKVNAS